MKMGRAPHGARGLKYKLIDTKTNEQESRPAWGAWIEIERVVLPLHHPASRAPHGARGLKLFQIFLVIPLFTSRPAWGAWIEILFDGAEQAAEKVAPRMGRVD